MSLIHGPLQEPIYVEPWEEDRNEAQYDENLQNRLEEGEDYMNKLEKAMKQFSHVFKEGPRKVQDVAKEQKDAELRTYFIADEAGVLRDEYSQFTADRETLLPNAMDDYEFDDGLEGRVLEHFK